MILPLHGALAPLMVPSRVLVPSTLNNGLIHYWSLEESGGLSRLDPIGGTILFEQGGTVNQVAGVRNFAAHFPATAWLADNGSAEFGSTFTVNGWVYKINNTGLQALVTQYEGAGLFGRFQIYSTSTSGRLAAIWVTTTGQSGSSTPETTMSTGVWHMFTYRFEGVGGRSRIQINSLPPGDSNITSGLLKPPGTLRFGRRGDGFNLNGYLDEVAVWNRILTDDEIEELFADGAGKFYPY